MAPRKSQVLSAASPACPNCGTELGMALIRQLAQPLIAQLQSDLEQELRQEVQASTAAELAGLQAQLKQQKAQYQTELGEKRAESELMRRQLDEAQRAERELRKARRQLQDEHDALEIERDRMRDTITAEERQKAEQRANERTSIDRERTEQQHRTQVQAMEDHIRALTEQLEAAHRKASAGPRPQQEGVAYQHVLADELRRRFPGDDIKVVARGKRGGNVVHTVRHNSLGDCGTILWECKQTLRFEPKWIKKLTDDIEAGRADLGVLVSSALPRDMNGSGILDGVLVCDTIMAVTAALTVRESVIMVKRFALANAARGKQSERVYDYITTGGFGARLERAFKDHHAALQELNTMREFNTRAIANLEKKQHDMLDQLFMMVGEVEATGAALPMLRTVLPPAQPRSLEPSLY
ncbi:DUF2130 domain-containing protein [Nocardia fusca]|uniref:DUF2130 domain-containing protein n=1 Tax=Nocardia fusca TaxID=941183 RepID=UPI0037C8864B